MTHLPASRLFLLTLLALLLGIAAQTQAAPTPQQELKASIDQILVVLADKDISDADKRGKIGVIVDARFDYGAMSQRVLSSNNWRQTDQPQRAQFSTLFGDLLKKTYFKAISEYTDQTVEFNAATCRIKKKDEKTGRRKTETVEFSTGLCTRKNVMVSTFIVSDGKKIPIKYRMRPKQDGWFVYDIKVEGISLVKSHQSTFLNIFKNKGMAGAIAELKEKVATKAAD